MFEPIEDMPAGTVGFRAHGALSEADYTDTLVPALRDAVAAGDVRLLLVTAPDFDGSDIRGQIEEAKSHLKVGGHRSDWKRVALATDNGWLRRSHRIWSRFVPVDVKVFKTSEEDEAKEWVAG
jgi:hypothetical protein